MDIPRIWRLRPQRYRLEGSQCLGCDNLQFPPVMVCPECRGRKFEPYRFSGEGEIYSYSVVYSPLTQFAEFVPYIVALVELKEGVMITTQLTDVLPENVSIGMPVSMVVRKISEQSEKGAIVYGYKFRPPITHTQPV